MTVDLLDAPQTRAPAITPSPPTRAGSNRAIQLACAYSAVPMVLALMVGLIAAGFIPPLHPSSSAEEIAGFYRENTNQIRIWLAISFLSITLLFPFGAVIAAQTRRIEGSSPVLTYIQIAGLASGSLIFVIPWICWFVAAFRPERSDSEIFLMNDLGWITFVTAFIAFSAWLIAIGIAILTDPRREPLFPRWLGYWNLFVALSFAPDICVPFFHSGAFSWTGIFPFYLPFTTYLIWIILMMIYTAKAVRSDPELTRM
jgi:hypothetical protein